MLSPFVGCENITTLAHRDAVRRGIHSITDWRWCKITASGLGSATVECIGPSPRSPDDRCPTRSMSRAVTRSLGRATMWLNVCRVSNVNPADFAEKQHRLVLPGKA